MQNPEIRRMELVSAFHSLIRFRRNSSALAGETPLRHKKPKM
jgi:hypothetical protein